MTNRNLSIIGKYAFVLSALYIISYIFNKIMFSVEFSHEPLKNVMFQSYGPLAFGLLLNSIAAFIVFLDIKKYSLETKYVVIATILYRPLGVFAFLLFLVYQDRFQRDNNYTA